MTKLDRALTPPDMATLEPIARTIRADVLRMVTDGGSSHVGCALSIVDLLVALYFHVLHVHPAAPDTPDRDRFILSKAHGGVALYATLAERGFFSKDVLCTFYKDGGLLAGHADTHGAPGVEVSAGSLGHGLAIGTGMALAARCHGLPYRVFVLLSDGECNEGSTWEAALAASSLKLDSVVALVDYNKLQGMGNVEDIISLEPLAEKWRSFGWETREVDGHNLGQIIEALEGVPDGSRKPRVIIAHTVKGKGVSFMENQVVWHYRTPNAEELIAALAEVGEAT